MSYSAQDPSMNARILAAEARAKADPMRPVYHFRSPAQWMNDPNGTIYSGGYYHIFYQFNPYGDSWDHMHWGHARSKDLVNWEYMPVALAPRKDLGEEHCYSGCLAIEDDGSPTILYTSVPFGGTGQAFCQRAAVGDGDFISWRLLEKPVIAMDAPGLPKLKGDWRDPYVFRSGQVRYLVLSAVTEDETPVVLLFSSPSGRLTDWEYRGVLIAFPTGGQLFECPNFFPLRGAWVLAASPFEPVRYFVGSFDEKAGRFIPMRGGLMDHSSEFYATNTLVTPSGETYLLAWIRAFPKGHGWNGCLALPRSLDLDGSGSLLARPAKELEALRAEAKGLGDCQVKGQVVRFQAGFLPASELGLDLEVGAASGFDLEAVLETGERLALLSLEAGTIHAHNTPAAMEALPEEGLRPLELRIFLDHSVFEAFVDGGRICVSHMIEALHQVASLELRLRDARLVDFRAWAMRPLAYTLHPSLPEGLGRD